MSERAVTPPEHATLVAELELIRRKGITKLRDLNLPGLVQAARAAGDAGPDQPVDAPLIEETIRRALDDLGGGRLGEATRILFGLEPGSRAESPTDLRASAADAWGTAVETFRRDPQTTAISELADAILRRAYQHAERLAHLALERRLPTTSRLAVAWLERFEAYYRVWTPISGIAGDLCAYRSTLLEPDRPYDREPGTDGPTDPGYSQENQAAGYLTTALWHFTRFLVERQRFISRYGGMWLLSDAQAESEVQDAIYAITWHSPNNERDDSFLRRLHERAGGELHPFRVLLETDRIARATEEEWREWAAQCHCTWNAADEVEREHFPTHRHHPGINRKCSLHAIVTACNDYTTLIDDDWTRVADWYRLPAIPTGMANDRKMYEEWRQTSRPPQGARQSQPDAPPALES
jgi:hypothetical protein